MVLHLHEPILELREHFSNRNRNKNRNRNRNRKTPQKYRTVNESGHQSITNDYKETRKVDCKMTDTNGNTFSVLSILRRYCRHTKGCLLLRSLHSSFNQLTKYTQKCKNKTNKLTIKL